jgi:hypothetical protein
MGPFTTITVESLWKMQDRIRKLEEVARCLEMTRGQWIHSVNADACLKALAALEDLKK